MSRNPPRTCTFIIRIWIEPRETAGEAEEWRGEARHVPSGRIIYFRRLVTLPGALQQFLDSESNRA